MPSITPKRMTLGNLENGANLEAQFNPKEVEIALQVFYNNAKVPGQTYEEMQYANTGNPVITFDLTFDGLSTSAPRSAPRTAPNLLDVEGFLVSLAYPPLKPGNVSSGAPPRILLSWPGWILLVSRMPKLTQKSTRFSADGPPTLQTYKVELQQSLTRRIGFDDVYRTAFRRSR